MDVILQILNDVGTALMVLILFGVTIFVHELGHFLVARRLGLVVDAFSIGFGPALFKWKRKGIEYKLGVLPFGGYVALPQLDPELGANDNKEGRKLPPIAPWKKIPVLLAGVTGNMILAFFIAVVIYWASPDYGPSPDGAVIGYVDTNSAAYAASLRPGDTVRAVNERPVKSWEDFIVEGALTDEVTLQVIGPEGDERMVMLDTEKISEGGRLVKGLMKQTPVEVFDVSPGGSAAEAGMQRGDRITHFAGREVFSTAQFITLVDQYREESVTVTVDREGERLALDVTPRYDEKLDRALIGIEFNLLDLAADLNRKPVAQIVRWGAPVFRFLQALVTPSQSKHAAQSVGGPVMIFKYIWVSLNTSFLLALWLTGMINVNLAILNMLPIPILDGGHIVFTLIEMVRGKPLHPKLLYVLFNLFAILLIGVMLLLSYRDVARMFSRGSGRSAPAEAVTNAVPADAATSGD